MYIIGTMLFATHQSLIFITRRCWRLSFDTLYKLHFSDYLPIRSSVHALYRKLLSYLYPLEVLLAIELHNMGLMTSLGWRLFAQEGSGAFAYWNNLIFQPGWELVYLIVVCRMASRSTCLWETYMLTYVCVHMVNNRLICITGQLFLSRPNLALVIELNAVLIFWFQLWLLDEFVRWLGLYWHIVCVGVYAWRYALFSAYPFSMFRKLRRNLLEAIRLTNPNLPKLVDIPEHQDSANHSVDIH